MNDTMKSMLMAVVGGGILVGVSFLTDRYLDAFWPTAAILIVGALIAMLFGIMAVPKKTSHRAIANIAVLIVLGSLFAAIVFVFWQRKTYSPIIFGGAWAVVTGAAAAIGTRAMAADMKKLGLDNPCPKCGRELKYKEEGYVGYTDEMVSATEGLRTRQYESIYVCRKCGYEGPRGN
ncbi:MAG: hypothetical protein M3539_02055 [Acidobacteriota bacterium]|nr:hypothetical protein [Acidobacteriota bacterium]